MSASCIKSCLLDIEAPVRVNFVKLYQWPHSDAEFLKELTQRKGNDTVSSSSSSSWSSQYHESFVSRQRYLRSYNFSRRRESAAQKTKKWLRLHCQMINHNNKLKRDNDISNKSSKGSNSCGGKFDALVNFLLSCMAKVDVHEEPASVILPLGK